MAPKVLYLGVHGEVNCERLGSQGEAFCVGRQNKVR